MSVHAYTEEELRDLFLENLEELVSSEEVNNHMTGFLIDFCQRTKLVTVGNKDIEKDKFEFIKNEKIDTAIIYEKFERGDYSGLVNLGDAYLFILGWFPEWASKKRKSSLGIDFYLNCGTSSYALALDLFYNKSVKTSLNASPGVVSQMVGAYPDNVCALVELKAKIGEKDPILDMMIYKELHSTVGYTGKKPSVKVVPLSVLNRRQYSTDVDNGKLFDGKDLSDIPTEEFKALTLQEVQDQVRIKNEEESELYLRLVK